MKNLKTYDQFFEDGTACVNASTTGGMGAVTNAVVGSIPGVPNGAPGSGDTSFGFGGVATKQPVGGPADVSDARFLKKEKTNKIEDGKKKRKKKDDEEEK
jgi:hypothetical protein